MTPVRMVRSSPGAMLRRVALGFGLLLATAPAVLAQSAICRQIESELASLGRGGGAAQSGQYARQAAAARSRLGAVQGTMSSIGCNSGGFLFGPQPPAQCAGLRAQAAALSGSIAQLEGASRQASNGSGARRSQLLAALDANNCRGGGRQQIAIAQQPAPQPAPQRPRGFFEALFGGGQSQPTYATETVPQRAEILDPALEQKKTEEKARKSVGGSMPVCVRTCDGFFFPVNYQGAGDDDQYAEVCQASCPASTAELYWMQAGADLDTAATEDGKRYTALPTAFSYRKSYDPACSCKAPGQSWGSVLRQADALIRDRRSDITVTQETSDQMARPQPIRELRGVKGQQAATKLPDGEVKTQTSTGTIVPPAQTKRVLGSEAGETRELNGKDGEKKNVRLLTPELAPAQ